MKTKILLLAANPIDQVQLRVDEEQRAIDAALHSSKYRDNYVLISQPAVRIEDLQALLLRHQPDIVHFSGHGSDAEEIILLDAGGKSSPVPAAALGELFGLLQDNIRCVVLNACYSEGQAKAIAEQIEVVVGMSDAIGDEAARKFAASFYRALASGRTVQNAFDLGCNEIDLSGIPEATTPRLLHMREGVDPETMVIARRSFLQRHARPLALAAAALVVALAVFIFVGLPSLARSANAQGLAALERDDLSGAQSAFERAVLFGGGNGRYHYNLGVAYELARQPDKALQQYQDAFRREQDYWPAYNSWGALKLKHGDDPAEALTTLRAGMNKLQGMAGQEGHDPTAAGLGAAVLGKNIGLAYLAQGDPQKALEEIAAAERTLLDLQAQGVDVRYYLASVYHAMAKAQEAIHGPDALETQQAWAKTQGFALSIADAGICPRYADLTQFFCADAQAWADEAARRLNE
jgi:tetratricopeptide (TPR) repeat protein